MCSVYHTLTAVQRLIGYYNNPIKLQHQTTHTGAGIGYQRSPKAIRDKVARLPNPSSSFHHYPIRPTHALPCYLPVPETLSLQAYSPALSLFTPPRASPLLRKTKLNFSSAGEPCGTQHVGCSPKGRVRFQASRSGDLRRPKAEAERQKSI